MVYRLTVCGFIGWMLIGTLGCSSGGFRRCGCNGLGRYPGLQGRMFQPGSLRL